MLDRLELLFMLASDVAEGLCIELAKKCFRIVRSLKTKVMKREKERESFIGTAPLFSP